VPADRLKFAAILFGLAQAFKFTARTQPGFAARLKERDLVAQIVARDEGTARWYQITNGKILSRRGVHRRPDVTMAFKNAGLGVELLMPPINWLDQINALKDFKFSINGPEDLTNWFAQTMMMIRSARWKFGVTMSDGVIRYCNMTNGGPVFVYVKDA